MKNKHVFNKSRRNAVLGAAGGASIISAWHKPIINSIVLPAHAQMSPVEPMDFRAGAATTVTTNNVVRNNTLMDLFVPQAYAQQEQPRFEIQAQALFVSDETYDVTIVLRDNRRIRFQGEDTDEESESQEIVVQPEPINRYQYKWSGEISGLNTLAMIELDAGCGSDEMAEFTAISDSGLSIEMSFFDETLSFDLEPGEIELPDVELCED